MSKATDYFFKNPFCILGLSCNADNLEVIKAQEKIEKLAKLGASNSFKTEYTDSSFPLIDRSSGVVQTALADIGNPINKLFWFATPEAIKINDATLLQFKLLEPNQIFYDSFLYLYIQLLSSAYSSAQENNWKQVLHYVSFLLTSSDTELSSVLLGRNIPLCKKIISNNILKPIIDYCDQENFDTVINIVRIIDELCAEGRMAEEIENAKHEISECIIENLKTNIEHWTAPISQIDLNKSVTSEQKNAAVNAVIEIKKICTQYVEEFLQSLDAVTIDRTKDIIYNNLNICANVLIAGISYKNASECMNFSIKYAPKLEVDSIKEAVKNLAELSQYEKKVVLARKNHELSANDEELLKHKDFSIRMLAMKATGGDSKSQYLLGALYDTENNALNIPYDEHSSQSWLEKASSNGNRDAKTRLGIKYLNEGITYSNHSTRKQGIDLLEEASYLGDQQATSLLSQYRSGRNAAVAKGVASGCLGCAIPTMFGFTLVAIGAISGIVSLIQLIV